MRLNKTLMLTCFAIASATSGLTAWAQAAGSAAAPPPSMQSGADTPVDLEKQKMQMQANRKARHDAMQMHSAEMKARDDAISKSHKSTKSAPKVDADDAMRPQQ